MTTWLRTALGPGWTFDYEATNALLTATGPTGAVFRFSLVGTRMPWDDQVREAVVEAMQAATWTGRSELEFYRHSDGKVSVRSAAVLGFP